MKIERLIKKPYALLSFLGVMLFLGIYGYNNIHKKLFPDSNRPQVAVVVVWPGASAKELASNVAVVVERELYSIDKIRRVYSSTIDEVSVINAEFEYSKDIDAAANDVNNVLTRIRAKLPTSILSPQIFKITAATQPIVTIALSSDQLPLTDVRQIAEDQLKPKLLQLEGIANVDIFGGYKKEVLIRIDPKRLDERGLSLVQVLDRVKKSSKNYAIGFMDTAYGRFLLRIEAKKNSLQQIEKIPVAPNVKLEDVAQISYGYFDNSALYFDGKKEAIAMAVQRASDADVVRSIEKVEELLKSFEKSYPKLHFHITDTQKETIELSISNMFESLRDAIVMSVIVAFFFLASLRQVLVVLFTIPLVYASTVAFMYLLGIEFNVVTLTAIILALGLLLDDAVVVMENIERHFSELKKPITQAVVEGTQEIMFADLSGTITTMAALFPIMFVGDYPQTIFRPLVGTLLIALAASYIISITLVPLLSLKFLAIKQPWILKFEEWFSKISDRFNEGARAFFAKLALLAIESKKVALLYFAILIGLFVLSARVVMPLVGQELMPPMDTGIVKIKITTDANLPIEKSKEIAQKVGEIVAKSGPLLRASIAVGSEAGVMSIGSGGGIDTLSITATYINRHERKETIWQIEDRIRKEIANIDGIKYFAVFDYGATALSSIRGNVDVMLLGEEFTTLQNGADKIYEVLMHTQGLKDIAKSWDMDKRVYELIVDEQRALDFGVGIDQISAKLLELYKGAIVGGVPRQNSEDVTMRAFKKVALEEVNIRTPKGMVPLSYFVKVKKVIEPTLITREDLAYSVDIYGFREKAAISHIMASFNRAFESVKLPFSLTVRQTGDIAQFEDSAKRMIKAVLFGVGLIFFVLVPMFNSFKAPLLIIISIPLTLIGASWILLLMDYHVSMPAMMGFILLSGIIVNNAILLIEFGLMKLKEGLSPKEAIIESIAIRTRPVLMTAFATTAGMLPVAIGSAIGLERLAPLGAVAIGGLMVGTFLTLVFIPILFTWSYKNEDLGSMHGK